MYLGDITAMVVEVESEQPTCQIWPNFGPPTDEVRQRGPLECGH